MIVGKRHNTQPAVLNERCHNAFEQRVNAIHAERLRSIKPRIDNTAPHTLGVNMKLRLMRRERMYEIAKQNRRLAERLETMRQRPGYTTTTVIQPDKETPRPRSLNYEARRQKHEEIAHENYAMHNRILERREKPLNISREEMKKFEEQHQKYQMNVRKRFYVPKNPEAGPQEVYYASRHDTQGRPWTGAREGDDEEDGYEDYSYDERGMPHSARSSAGYPYPHYPHPPSRLTPRPPASARSSASASSSSSSSSTVGSRGTLPPVRQQGRRPLPASSRPGAAETTLRRRKDWLLTPVKQREEEQKQALAATQKRRPSTSSAAPSSRPSHSRTSSLGRGGRDGGKGRRTAAAEEEEQRKGREEEEEDVHTHQLHAPSLRTRRLLFDGRVVVSGRPAHLRALEMILPPVYSSASARPSSSSASRPASASASLVPAATAAGVGTAAEAKEEGNERKEGKEEERLSAAPEHVLELFDLQSATEYSLEISLRHLLAASLADAELTEEDYLRIITGEEEEEEEVEGEEESEEERQRRTESARAIEFLFEAGNRQYLVAHVVSLLRFEPSPEASSQPEQFELCLDLEQGRRRKRQLQEAMAMTGGSEGSKKEERPGAAPRTASEADFVIKPQPPLPQSQPPLPQPLPLFTMTPGSGSKKETAAAGADEEEEVVAEEGSSDDVVYVVKQED